MVTEITLDPLALLRTALRLLRGRLRFSGSLCRGNGLICRNGSLGTLLLDRFRDILRVMFKEFRISLLVGAVLALANGVRIMIQYQSVSLTLKLVGENVGTNSEMTWIVKRPPFVDVTGQFQFGEEVVQISEEDGKYWIAYFSGDDAKQFPATRTDNSLTIDNTAALEVNVKDYGLQDVILCGFDGQYLYPDKPSIWNFSRDGKTISHNGWFLGFETPDGWGTFAAITPDVDGKKLE